MALREPQAIPDAHGFVVKQFDGSRARHAGCTGCAWIGPFVYDNTAEEREQLASAFNAKHRTITQSASVADHTQKRNP
jgi:hypothetical protein